MNDDLVRDKVRLYVDDVTPDQLPPFSGVALRRKQTRARQVVGATAAVVVVVLAVAFGALFAGTGSVRTPETSPGSLESQLVGPVWQLASVVAKGKFVPIQADSRPTLRFTAGAYDLFDSCNDVEGSLGYGSGTIIVAAGSQSAVACPDPGSLQEVLHAAFGGLLHVSVTGRSLTLIGASTTTTWSGAGPAPTSATRPSMPAADLRQKLVGPRWRLVAIDAPGTYWRAAPGSTASLSLTSTNFQATDGCSSRQSAISFDDGGIVFGGKESSAGACSMAAPGPPEGTFPPELFFRTLDGRLSAVLTDGVLTLTRGTTVLTLTTGHTAYVDPNAGDKLQTLLTAHTWSLHRIISGGKTWGDPQQVVLQFGAQGYKVNPDCNEHTGAVSYAAGQLVMRGVMQTRAACGAGQVVQARSAGAIDALATGAVSVEEDGGLLMLWNGQTSIELHQGSAPQGDLGLNLPPDSSPGVAGDNLRSTLEATRWQLLTVDGPGAGSTGHWAVPPESGTLAFGSRKWDASDTCNDHQGSLLYGNGSAAGGTLLMAPGSSSAMLCPTSLVRRLETLEASDLARPVTVSISGDRLTMQSGDDTLLFRRGASGVGAAAVPADNSDLTDLLTSWTWQVRSWTLNGVTGAIPATAAEPQTLVFNFQSAASSGCGAMDATVAYHVTSVTFSGAAIPAVACAAPGGSPQSAFVRLFAGVAQVGLAGTTLTLSGHGLVMNFTAGASRFPA